MTHPLPTDPLRAWALPALARAVEACQRLLARADAHASRRGLDASALLATRLAPDMFCLAHQVQVLADGVEGAVALLAGDARAACTAWVFNRGDERTLGPADTRLDQAQARLEAARARLAAIGPETPLLALPAPVVVARPGQARRFVVDDFTWRYVLPNAVFHVSMVHALLRAAGVPVGKADFEGPPAYELVEEAA